MLLQGAALYSALEKAEIVAIVTELSELGKAYDQYYIDTRKELKNSSYAGYLKIVDLIEKPAGVTGWKGPYIKYAKTSYESMLDHDRYNYVFIEELLNAPWGGTLEVNWGAARCSLLSGLKAGDCGVWADMSFKNGDVDLVKKIDNFVDGSVNGADGKLRWFVTPSNTYYVLLKVRNSYRY